MLARDVIIKPVAELPKPLLKSLFPDGKIPEGYYGIEREKVRTPPKIVNQDVVDVLEAFREGATYPSVLEHFASSRKLDREKLDRDMRKMVGAFVQVHYLVEAGIDEPRAVQAIKPSFQPGDHWLRYKIVENIRALVDSEIYRVEDTRTGEPAALKIAQKNFPDEREKEMITRRLRHEFDVIRTIDHPGVVKLRENGEHNGRVYGILDWMDGPNVRRYAHEKYSKRPPDAFLHDLGCQCVAALRAVHEAGYLHGDVHTGNFMTRKGRVCLIDFGFARPIEIGEKQTSRYTEGGVTNYLPPEYAGKYFKRTRGLWNSVRGEIYSCGVILYELLTGGMPQKWQPYRDDYLKSIIEVPPLPFSERDRTAWPEIEAVLARAMAKKKSGRFRSLATFQRALEKIRPTEVDGDA